MGLKNGEGITSEGPCAGESDPPTVRIGFDNFWQKMPTKWLQKRVNGSKHGVGITSLEKVPVLDLFP